MPNRKVRGFEITQGTQNFFLYSSVVANVSTSFCSFSSLLVLFWCSSIFVSLLKERALAVTELGSALKFETDEPHFVSLGGGRLSIGVTLCPIKRGRLLELALHFIYV